MKSETTRKAAANVEKVLAQKGNNFKWREKDHLEIQTLGIFLIASLLDDIIVALEDRLPRPPHCVM